VRVVAQDGNFVCPRCGKPSAGYDKRLQRWRHLDTMQYHTILEAEVPRVNCQEHGVLTIDVPWAESGSGFTALFEALVIDWLQEASLKAVAEQLALSWGAVDRIMQRAVQRGLARREDLRPVNLSVDETSFQKHHEYVTVVTDQDQRRVLYVADDRSTGSLDGFYQSLQDEQRKSIRSVAMDMWPAFIGATQLAVPDALSKIAFDKFHVAKYLGDAVDKVRRQEHRSLKADGDERLKGTKYAWLRNPANMTTAQKHRLDELRKSTLKTARAWALKQEAMSLWDYTSRGWAARAWQNWLSWAQRCRLKPMQDVARTIKRHLWGILNAIVLKSHNGHSESMNSRIQRIKRQACGFRNRERFRNAIYFHCGGLSLYPTKCEETASPT
jgi:transposase